MFSTKFNVVGLTVLGLVSATDMNIRFNKGMDGTGTLTGVDFPVDLELANHLRNTDAVSVTIQEDCTQCLNIQTILDTAWVDPPIHPSSDSDSPFWDDFRDVIGRQLDRLEGKNPGVFLPLPNIWRHFDIHEVAEAVHDEFPGVWHAALLGEFLTEGVEFDRNTLPALSNVDFINGAVALSGLNGWAFANVGPTNFGAKWHNGRARPEEVAFLISEGDIGTDDGVPDDVIDMIELLDLETATEFTAYPEGSPVHPSWPAMHSASSVGSLWIPTVLNLTPEQLCEVRKLDYAIAYARTVAGVHFPTDNTAGLNLGQEVVAEKLPSYLVDQYGASNQAVKDKIEGLRFDWRTFHETDCYKDGLAGAIQRLMDDWCVNNKAAGQSYARYNNQNYGWHWRCCAAGGDRTNNRCMSDDGELVPCEDPTLGNGNCHSVYGDNGDHLTGTLGLLALANIADACDPTQWSGYDGEVCGACSALVKVRDNGGTCEKYCELQGMQCVDSWDDENNGGCSTFENAAKLGCSHAFTDTSDGICQCSPTGRRRIEDLEAAAELKAPLMA